MITKNISCLAAADVHGNIFQYEKILKLVRKKNISCVFLVGDLFPKDGGAWSPSNLIRSPEIQRDFIQNYFLPYLARLGSFASVYGIFGNDDFKSNYDLIKMVRKSAIFLNDEVVPLPLINGDFFVAGYPYVSLTPYLLKDWEKWDDSSHKQTNKIFRTDGYLTSGSQFVPVDLLDKPYDLMSISDDLEKLAKKSDPKKTIYMIHEPPFNTPLDMIFNNNKYINEKSVHIGSKSIRNFIQNHVPLLTIHGHIHETFEVSGDFQIRNQASVAVTPSNDYRKNEVSCILFNFSELSKVERVIL